MNNNCFPFSFSDGTVELKIFKTGRELKLRNTASASSDPENLRGIHTHFTYEVFFVTEGTLELVTDRDTAVYERTTVILPPKLQHYSISSGEGSFCLLFSTEDPQLRQLLDPDVRTLPLDGTDAFYIHRAAACLKEPLPDIQEIRLLIRLLFHRILRSLLPQKTSGNPERSCGHTNAIEQYLNNHLSEKITLADVAAHVYLSPRQVSRIVSKEWGCTLVELVTEKRLDRARILLEKTELKIDEIARRTSVGSTNYFYTLFKRRYGLSPLQYRKAFGSQDRSRSPEDTVSSNR